MAQYFKLSHLDLIQEVPDITIRAAIRPEEGAATAVLPTTLFFTAKAMRCYREVADSCLIICIRSLLYLAYPHHP